MMKFENIKYSILTLMAFLMVCNSFGQFDSDLDIRFKGAGWMKAGRIMQSSDTILGERGANYTGNWMQDAGALFNSIVGLSDEIEGSFGVGVILKHRPQGALEQAAKVDMNIFPFVNMARMTYTMGGKEGPSKFKLTTGLFSYKYDYNVKNLGLYLIRGPVYPGLLISGFESKEMLPSANMLGFHVQSNFGPYTQDVLLVSETDMHPKFDYSLLYIGTYKPTPWLELGAGVNFYHLIPVRSGVTTPNKEDGFDPTEPHQTSYIDHPNQLLYTIIDTVNLDTTWVSHKGTKVMARFALDFKPLLGLEDWGKSDLKMYMETGIIGLKDYPRAYDDITKRIPVVFGFNIPTFFLNVLALEIEYYNSDLVPDLRKLKSDGSPIPQSPWQNRSRAGTEPPYDVTKDNLKWSLYGAKVIAGHVKFSGQIANDHLRTDGFGSKPTFEEALTRIGDWYWMFKTTFFF